MCAVVLSGAVDVTIDGMKLGTAMRAGDVFESAADAAYVPPSRALELVSRGDALVAVAAAPLADRPAGRARLIGSSEQTCAPQEPGTGREASARFWS